MRRVFVVTCCAALTVLGGAHASAQVLPPPGATQSESVGVGQLADVWVGLKAITGLGW